MINLLPTSLKRELRSARINARLVHYLWLTGAVAIILGIIFAGAAFYLMAIGHQASRDLSNTQGSLAGFSSFQTTADATSQRLAAIKKIEAGQTRFSLLLDDLAKVLPQGTALSGITLTGDATKSVQINVTADSYDHALAFRDAIATSPRIAAADLVGVSSNDKGYVATVVIAFKAGAAK